MVLVDTSVWIDFLQGHPSKQEIILENLIEDEEEVCLCSIHLMEILQGIKKKSDFQKIESNLRNFPIYNPEIDDYVFGAQIFSTCKKKGFNVKSADCLIAATAINNELILLHKDKDFNNIEKLTYLETFPV